jgi:RHS repeat-associated protein
LHLVDGGAGDSDGQANGVIVDPGGPLSPCFDGTNDDLYYCEMPDTPPVPCDKTEVSKAAPGAYDHSVDSGATFSPSGVRYFDGLVTQTSNDLGSGGFDRNWGQTRIWSNGIKAKNLNGDNTTISQIPYLTQPTSSTVAVVTSAINIRNYDLVGSNYVPREFVQDTLVHTTSPAEFVFTDTAGDQIHFYDFSTSLPANQRGMFKSLSDPDGNATSVTSWTGDGKPAEVQRSTTSGGVTTTESFLYTYITSGTNAGKMSNVTLRRQVNGGAWTTVRQAAYAYYDGTQSHGNGGDLMTVTVEDGSGNALDTSYYRYYTGESGGPVEGLKYFLGPQSYARLVAALGTNLSSLTDTQVAPYADASYQYNSSAQVTQAVIQGAGCSSCGTGQGTFTYSYSASSFTNGYNSWKHKTVETLPDGNQNIVYTNYVGEVMLKVYHDLTSGSNWETFYKFDGSGRIILKANPSALTGYDDTKADLLNSQSGNYQYMSDNSGLVEVTDYGTSTTATSSSAGDVLGYYKDTKLQQGELGSPMLQRTDQYFSQTANGVTVYPMATRTVYRNTDGTSAETTSFSYTWFAGTVQQQSVAVSLPVVSAAQNGPGTADVQTTFFDTYARPIWTKDGDGFINYTAYDPATSGITKKIVDVDTTRTGDFQNLPSGWSTPSGGGLHLITQMVVDGLGRTTQLTDPNGNVTYTVYLDTNHEVRVYPGWQTATNTTTGPTQDYREDRGHSPSYLESLTMSATPHVTNGAPDGTEVISNVQTLSRQYFSAAGQMTRADAYFNLSGVTWSTSLYIGTQNTNYYTKLYDYDERGRLNRTQLPTGTVNRTVYDGLSRIVSTWVGTNDTPGNGQEWTPSNNTPPSNMVQITGNVYDGGGVGDNNLTQVTQYPGGSAANRVTQFWFDWRDRSVASKQGVQRTEDTTTHRPIYYYDLDNLGEAIGTSHYDADGVTLTVSSGVPQKPANNLLREYSTADFDDQGRVFGTHVFSVDQSTGSVSSSSLNTLTWYNHRKQIIKILQPGGLVSKTQYDGAGRVVVRYATDGSGDTGWSSASTVTGNNVLSQIENQYDSNGNIILQTDRERFDSETATGALGNPNTAPLARVSYVASYFDAANRLVATVDVGTNGGAAYTRPANVPPVSDTVLVTSSVYTAAGWVDSVTDPRGIVQKNLYDNLGRITKSIAAYTDGTPTNNTNKATEYTYDGSNHVLTLQADLPGGAYQQSKYVYGVTTASGSNVNSNDLLAALQYPDKTTGNPSSSQQETYTVNALGETLTKTDRNGSVHMYTYDVLGRQTVDAVTTLGTAVDGSVLRIETGYDTGDRPYLYTSYNASTGGSVVNQVQQVYNGLGQLITEYQSSSGAVNTSTTPKVQYAYSQMSGGANHSRLISMTYPNGRVLNYNYNTGVDDTISRLSSLSDSSATLESYSYLGLSIVVKRSHPQPGVDLTYIKQAGESNGDAGDKYTGLDRFGRVVDQRWLVTATGTHTDRFQYGYDRNSNRLYRNNLVNTAFGELYHVSGGGNGYDNLNQLTGFARGVLSASVPGGVLDTVASPSHSQSWTFDALGNWSTFTSDGTSQNRSHNAQNQITSISGSTTPTYDNNGNTTGDQAGNTMVFDAWNRLVTVKNSGGTAIATYTFDAMGRRVTEASGGTTRILYFSSVWQLLEEDVGGAMQDQYVWSTAYVDGLVERDTPSQRLYVQQDADWNVTAVIDTSGNVQERYVYDPYGKVTILAPDWSTRASSSFSWVYLYQGGRYDFTAGLSDFRNREYSPILGRWMQVDPLGFYAGDMSLYRYESSNPPNALDPGGLFDFSGGIRQDFQLCFPIPATGNAVSLCIVVTVEGNVFKCCNKACGQIFVHGSGGVYLTGFTKGSGSEGWWWRFAPDLQKYKRMLANFIQIFYDLWTGKYLGAFTSLLKATPALSGRWTDGCPREGLKGNVCITASFGISTAAAGCRTCWTFPGGDRQTVCGWGVGNGFGIAVGIGFQYTLCW